jgi:hypothetical protein
MMKEINPQYTCAKRGEYGRLVALCGVARNTARFSEIIEDSQRYAEIWGRAGKKSLAFGGADQCLCRSSGFECCRVLRVCRTSSAQCSRRRQNDFTDSTVGFGVRSCVCPVGRVCHRLSTPSSSGNSPFSGVGGLGGLGGFPTPLFPKLSLTLSRVALGETH